MRILLLGGTGNLGLRLIPALLAHGHTVTAYVRSVDKLRNLMSAALFEKISTYEGDALDSSTVEAALREHDCNAVMNTAGNMVVFGPQILGRIATSVSSAAVRVGKDRGKPLRAWFIGGLNLLEYPGTGGWKIQDYMPTWGINHHRQTAEVMKGLSTADIEWSLLCVGMMRPESEKIDLLSGPRHQNLAVAVDVPPMWQDSWIRRVPLVGVYLNLIPGIMAYTTKLEDVADLLADDFDKGNESSFVGEQKVLSSTFVGELFGMKDVGKSKGN